MDKESKAKGEQLKLWGYLTEKIKKGMQTARSL